MNDVASQILNVRRAAYDRWVNSLPEAERPLHRGESWSSQWVYVDGEWVLGDPSQDWCCTVTLDDTVVVWAAGNIVAEEDVPGAAAFVLFNEDIRTDVLGKKVLVPEVVGGCSVVLRDSGDPRVGVTHSRIRRAAWHTVIGGAFDPACRPLGEAWDAWAEDGVGEALEDFLDREGAPETLEELDDSFVAAAAAAVVAAFEARER